MAELPKITRRRDFLIFWITEHAKNKAFRISRVNEYTQRKDFS